MSWITLVSISVFWDSADVEEPSAKLKRAADNMDLGVKGFIRDFLAQKNYNASVEKTKQKTQIALVLK
ncbi:hypothetical protein [Microbulbifer sp. THAF38]|uniref:hypothetical protein n=1 Tax=Microbulbifer sp. THAF38 TaxID=2587856 RepID=UPI0012680B86|nr:hypothetical protein [Microbulbifer sp. THAF38]